MAAFRFVVVVAFDLTERPKLGVEVLLKGDECCLGCEKGEHEKSGFHDGQKYGRLSGTEGKSGL